VREPDIGLSADLRRGNRRGSTAHAALPVDTAM
jgi:hypothetical protein